MLVTVRSCFGLCGSILSIKKKTIENLFEITKKKKYSDNFSMVKPKCKKNHKVKFILL